MSSWKVRYRVFIDRYEAAITAFSIYLLLKVVALALGVILIFGFSWTNLFLGLSLSVLVIFVFCGMLAMPKWQSYKTIWGAASIPSSLVVGSAFGFSLENIACSIAITAVAIYLSYLHIEVLDNKRGKLLLDENWSLFNFWWRPLAKRLTLERTTEKKMSPEDVLTMQTWCAKNCRGPFTSSSNGFIWHFLFNSDVMAFKLRWM